jgi:F-type H+-transporting ATPase subunit b
MVDTMLIWAAEEEHNPLLPPLGEIIIGLIAFAVVLFVMFKYVAPQFEKAFVARRDAIEGGIERAEAMQAEAKAALEQYRAQLAEARTEAAQIRDAARAEGQQIIEELRAQAQEESARIVARGEEQLTASRQQVVTELRAQIGTLAVDLAGRVVGESLADDARRSGTVDRFLDDLDGMSAPSSDGRGGSSVYVPQDAR